MQTHPIKNGSQAVDVYAFGVLLWECHESKYPYMEELQKLGKFALLKKVELGKARPKLPSPERATSRLSQCMITLMQDCWHQDPKER